MKRKIIFFFLINIFIFVGLEIIVKFTLKKLNYPTVYETGRIEDGRYDYLTGYYNYPNQNEKNKDSYKQATDEYGFNLDGIRLKNADLSVKNKCEYRLFIVGGSTTQGRSLINRQDPLSARIETLLNKFYKSEKINFIVINTGSTSFLSSQELALIQYKILYSLKPDHIIVFNGTNDFSMPLGNKIINANSHYFQREFQSNFQKASRNIFYFFDDFLKKNLSLYFATKKIIENPKIILPFIKSDKKKNKFYQNLDTVENHVQRYFFNINIMSKISTKETPISVFFQPTMLPENKNNLSNHDLKIYNNFLKSKYNYWGDKDYFSSKQTYYEKMREGISNFEKKNHFNNYFQLKDLSKIFYEIKNQDFYSDYVHYLPSSRQIISENIFNAINTLIKEKIISDYSDCK
mgnify:CR=1 FL=1|tara:strand:- start:140 stop:1354 length:1215 start_codon:yes stop_codon:yes gene_type:complete